MTESKQTFLDLLRSFTTESTPTAIPSADAWPAILRLAEINNVLGIIGYVVMTNPQLAPERLSEMRSLCLQTIQVYAQRGECMHQLISLLTESGIDHLLFKGYIVRDLYPVPELRTFGDIDFLIRPEDRERCDALMMAQGFTRKNDWEPVYSYIRGAEFYEIHTDVMEVDVSSHADYKGYFSHIWEHAEPAGGRSFVPDTEFHLLYLLTHIAKHISSSGAGIRMYMDIAFYLKKYRSNIDWNHFMGEAEKLSFTSFVNIVFTAVEQWFGVESPIPLTPIDEAVMEDFLNYTLDGGVFGKIGRDSATTYLKNEDINTETIDRRKTLAHRLFPSASEIESRYTYLQGHHWLLPAAWVHRLLKTRDSWGAHAQQAKDILNADDEEVLRLRRIYKEIGL